MFLTRTALKSPTDKLSVDKDEHFWESVELVKPTHWVMLTIKHTQVESDGNEIYFNRVVFQQNFMSFFNQRIRVSEGEKVQLVAAQIFFPSEDPSEGCSMEQVAKMWLAESEEKSIGLIEVCETKEGNKYILSKVMDYKIKLKNPRVVFKF